MGLMIGLMIGLMMGLMMGPLSFIVRVCLVVAA